jgi:hypothetical protein
MEERFLIKQIWRVIRFFSDKDNCVYTAIWLFFIISVLILVTNNPFSRTILRGIHGCREQKTMYKMEPLCLEKTTDECPASRPLHCFR